MKPFWIFFSIGIVLLALLIFVVVCICKKFKKVKHEYDRLLTDNVKSSDNIPTGGFTNVGNTRLIDFDIGEGSR